MTSSSSGLIAPSPVSSVKSVESVEPVLEEDVDEYVDKFADQGALEEQDEVDNRGSYLVMSDSWIQYSLVSTQLDSQICHKHCFNSTVLDFRSTCIKHQSTMV